MHCNYAMMSPRVILPEEEEGADVDGAELYRAEQEEEAAKSDWRDLNCALLHFTVA